MFTIIMHHILSVFVLYHKMSMLSIGINSIITVQHLQQVHNIYNSCATPTTQLQLSV